MRPLQQETSLRIQVNAEGFLPLDTTVVVELKGILKKRFNLPDLTLKPLPASRAESIPIVPEMVYVPGGAFLMGSPQDEPDRSQLEVLHEVQLSPYEIGRYEVTNAEYFRFLNAHQDSDSLQIWIDPG